ncbi:MAG: zinc ribbon domain-containing protein [Rhizobiales bacterium]|nr:zinc ribbon domain-containing protein [Rhizobacter sp.]
MPIYAYRCTSCGHAKDVLQKMSDAVLTDCPQCGKPTFAKQVTAAGFQLKGSGWYVTDFRGDNKAPPKPAEGAAPENAKSDAPKTDAPTPATAAKSDAGAPASAPAPAPAPSPAPVPSPNGSK